jgi:hypothetical protein
MMDDDERGTVLGMREIEVLGEKIPQCYFGHHKSYMT